MIDDTEYEVLKTSFINSQRLFDKLRRVYAQYQDIEMDESGFSLDEEEVLQRHWVKLSSKIVDALSEDLKEYTIELKKNNDLEKKELFLKLIKDNEVSEIIVDYSEDDSLNIIKLS